MRILVILLVLSLLAQISQAGDIAYKRVAAPQDALAYAALDLVSVPPADQPFQRYIWCPDPTNQKLAAVVYALNSISEATTGYRPVILHGGALMRVDLRGIAPRKSDFNRIHSTWEELALTNFRFNTIRPTKQVQVLSIPQPAVNKTERRVVDGYWKDVVVAVPQPPLQQSVTKDVILTEFAIHSGMPNALLLHTLAGQSKAPIVTADQFIQTSLSVLDGGLYYKFTGFDEKRAGTSDLDLFLQKLGTNRQEVDNLRSDQRIAMFRSGVTGKPRRVVFWTGQGVRATVGAGVVTITDDFRDGNIDPKNHPVKSLASRKADAHEVIVMKRNGFLAFALFDGNGSLANEVPPDIAADHSISAPNTRRLEPAMSCIACHGPSEGFIKASNDVKRMLAGFKTASGNARLQVYDDEQLGPDIADNIDRIAGWFDGDAETTVFRQARNDHERAVYVAAGGVGTAAACAEIVGVRDTMRFGLITPKIACKELGYEVPDEATAVKLFGHIVPILPPNGANVSPEDPVIAALRSYDPADPTVIRRSEWEPIYSDVMLRVKSAQVKAVIDQKASGK